MFDIGWSELLLTGIVALIVIGPKELPSVLRGIGASVGKLRRMAGEFQSQFNEALREAELDGLKKDIASIRDTASSLTSGLANPMQTIGDELKSSIEAPASAMPAPADMPTVDQMFTPDAPAPLDLSNPPDPGAVEPPAAMPVAAAAVAEDAPAKPKRTRKKKADPE